MTNFCCQLASLRLQYWNGFVFNSWQRQKYPDAFPPALCKSYRHKYEYLLSLCSHTDQKQKHWEGKDTVWIHGRAWTSMWQTEKSPSLLSHHIGRTVDESWYFGDLAATQDGTEAASRGSLEGELPGWRWTKDKPWREMTAWQLYQALGPVWCLKVKPSEKEAFFHI